MLLSRLFLVCLLVFSAVVGVVHVLGSQAESADTSLNDSSFSSVFTDFSLANTLAWFGRTYNSGPNVVRTTPEAVLAWLEVNQTKIDFTAPTSEVLRQMSLNFLARAELEARTILGSGDPAAYVHPEVMANDYPYFGFIPAYLGGVIPGATSPLTWSGTTSSCFQTNRATLTSDASNTTFTLTITAEDPQTTLCSDFYVFATLDGYTAQTLWLAGTYVFTWTLSDPTDAALVWDLHTKGIRVLRFRGSVLDVLANVIDTALLFEAETTVGVSSAAAARNLDFLAKYAGIDMTARANTTEIVIDESEIESGDMFALIRLDGTDPMLAWAMGSTTGHVAVAVWIGDELYVCESTTKAVHWPVNGVQKTPYRTWLAQVKAAGQQAVFSPLTDEASQNFNQTAAIEWFLQQEGLDYGYHTLLWGWIDTDEDNYPCLPPDWGLCLTWEVVEILFGFLDEFAPPAGQLLFNEAFNKRLNTVGLKAPDLFMEAANQGYLPAQLPTIVEEDGWQYNTTRYGVVTEGRSLVCCVFVCGMWKSGGLFGTLADTIECAELTNWDDYALDLLDPTPTRPAACVSADPNNVLCQVEGAYTLELNDLSTKAPYPHMAEKCPSQPPDYTKPATC